MNQAELFLRYQELQNYLGWTEADTLRIQAMAARLEAYFPPLIDDFYAAIEQHAGAVRVITGGAAQITRLKGTLLNWLRELVSGPYDADYVQRRWQVGWRHVEIGLAQVFTNMALARLRVGLCQAVEDSWQGKPAGLRETLRSLNKLLDLDLAIIEDAYQREYMARLRRRSEAAFRTLVEAAPCLIVILNSRHAILYFSPGAERVSGWAEAEVLGQNYIPLLVPSACQDTVRQALALAQAATPAHNQEVKLVCRDGSQRWLLWNAQCLPHYEGGPAVLTVGHDITEQKEAQDRAFQAERLAAIGQMMAGLAHESGNALARSQACLEMLSLEVDNRPEALELIARVQAAQDHLRQLYNDVRGYAAPVLLELENWDVGGIWRQAWQNLEVQRRGRVALLREHLEQIDLNCAVDNFRLEQVFRNIFENSLAACQDPVRIDIGGTAGTLHGRPALHLAVRDNGPGLEAGVRQKIFDPFFTTKSKGTGLGMAIAKRIIEAHQGQIAVGPGTGCGAEIVILLPREQP